MLFGFHILGFIAIIIPLWVLAPRGDANVVLLELTNYGGWSTTGLSAMIGLIAPTAVLTGYDCSAHMGKSIHVPDESCFNAFVQLKKLRMLL